MNVHGNRMCSAVAVFCGLLLLVSCTPPPALETVPLRPAQPLSIPAPVTLPSFINVPLSMNTRVVEEMLNRQIQGTLYENDTLAIGAIKPVAIRVSKMDSITITLEGDEVAYRVPLRISLRFAFTIGALGLSHTEYQTAEAAIALSFTSRLFVKNDWKVVTMTEAKRYDWLSDPVIKVRFITIPVKTIADLLLGSLMKNIPAQIDREINAVFNVKKLLLPLWSKIQEPLLLSDDPTVWLRLSPRSVYMTQPEGCGGKIMSSVGIMCVAETFFNEPASTKRDSLPDFVIPGKVDSSFVLNLHSEMSYDAASAFLQGYLLGRSFKDGRKEVIIEKVTIVGTNGYALIGLDFVGSYRGRVYVFGRPVVDTAAATVSIEDLSLDLKMHGAGNRAADWLFHGVIVDKIKPFLKFSFREQLLESRLMVQKMLCHSELAKNIFLTGSIDALHIGGVELTDEAIRAVVYAKGSLVLTVHD